MANVQSIAPTFEIELNGALVTYLQPLEVGRFAGGKDLDYAILQLMQFPVRLPTANLQNVRLISSLDQGELEITLVTDGGRRDIIHWGFIDQKSFDLAQHENQCVTSRLQPYHFGEPILGQRVFAPSIKKAADCGLPIVFNCELDGRIANTLSNRIPTTSEFLFLPPECQRSVKAMATNGATKALPWTLPIACKYLCTQGNAAERYIRNPSLVELMDVLPSDPGILRNHRQPFGEYLPANLDALLEPYGFVWYVDVSDSAGRVIRVRRRGYGDPLLLRLQVAGSDFDFGSDDGPGTSIEGFEIAADVSNRLCNKVMVIGDQVQIEDTFELIPAWDPKYDNYPLDSDNLEKLRMGGGETRAWENEPALARAWRDFVANEDGSYSGLRPTPPKPKRPEPERAKPDPWSGFFDFNKRIGLPLQVMACRRRFHPCLTLGTDGRPIGEHHGIVIEYFEYEQDTQTNAVKKIGRWKQIPGLTDESACNIQILQKECGIRFSGDLICAELFDKFQAGGWGKVRIRVTATVEMDARISFTTTPVPSPNVHPVIKVVDVPTRFKQRALLKTSKHFAKVVGLGDLKSTSVNDQVPARQFAVELLANWNQASVNGTISLPGTDWDLKDPIGRPFQGLAGRQIDFQTTAAGVPIKYPTVMGYKLYFGDQQRTVLHLDTWRRDV